MRDLLDHSIAAGSVGLNGNETQAAEELLQDKSGDTVRTRIYGTSTLGCRPIDNGQTERSK